MDKNKNTKVILFYSPLSQSGQTTIATYTGLELAKRGNYVLFVEMDRYSGTSPFLHKKINSYKKRLKNVLERPDFLKDNIEKSCHSENFFFLCQPVNSDLNELMSYNSTNIDIFLEKAVGVFDYIILDLDSNILDPATMRIFNKSFKIDIDFRVAVMNEDVKAFKRFTNTNSMFMSIGKEGNYNLKTSVVLNRSHFRYSDFMEKFLISQPGVDICNVINVIEFPELRYYTNQGDLYNIGKSSLSKEFINGITSIVKFVEYGMTGEGINYKKKISDIEKKLKRAKISKEKQEEKMRKMEENSRSIIYIDQLKNTKDKKSKKSKTKNKLDSKYKKDKKQFSLNLFKKKTNKAIYKEVDVDESKIINDENVLEQDIEAVEEGTIIDNKKIKNKQKKGINKQNKKKPEKKKPKSKFKLFSK